MTGRARAPAQRPAREPEDIPFGLRRYPLAVAFFVLGGGRAGDVVAVDEEAPRGGGWRTCRVRHRGGELTVRSSRLPSDEAFSRICERLRALAGPR